MRLLGSVRWWVVYLMPLGMPGGAFDEIDDIFGMAFAEYTVHGAGLRSGGGHEPGAGRAGTTVADPDAEPPRRARAEGSNPATSRKLITYTLLAQALPAA